MKRNKKRGIGLIALGVLLLTAALALTIHNRAESDEADAFSDEVMEVLREEIPEWSAPVLWNVNGSIVLATEPAEAAPPEMPAIEINGEQYIGFLTIPDENVEVPVLANWDFDKLERTPGHYYGSYYTNDLVIAGHNYTNQLGKLLYVHVNTDIYFINAEGLVFHYVVDNIETIQPTQLEEMISGDWDMTVFTCNLGGQTRRAVRCVLVTD